MLRLTWNASMTLASSLLRLSYARSLSCAWSINGNRDLRLSFTSKRDLISRSRRHKLRVTQSIGCSRGSYSITLESRRSRQVLYKHQPSRSDHRVAGWVTETGPFRSQQSNQRFSATRLDYSTWQLCTFTWSIRPFTTLSISPTPGRGNTLATLLPADTPDIFA